MGTKSPDVIRVPPIPETALTLAEMHLQGWELMAFCRRCGVRLRVGLDVMIRAHGPDAIWWGRRPKCPVWECEGTISYKARSITGGTWRSMDVAPNARIVEAWKIRRQKHPGPR